MSQQAVHKSEGKKKIGFQSKLLGTDWKLHTTVAISSTQGDQKIGKNSHNVLISSQIIHIKPPEKPLNT
jgi:hypothetical protein